MGKSNPHDNTEPLCIAKRAGEPPWPCYLHAIGIGRTLLHVSRAAAAVVTLALFAGCDDRIGPTRPTDTPGADDSPSQPAPVPDQTLVGAGDIGFCGSPAPEATARLIDAIPGAVFTTGDNAYMEGSAKNFAECYEPNWGRHKGRTYPSPGNHDYGTPGAAGYFSYFGSRAGPSGLGYYSFDLGNWHIVSLNSNVAHGAGSAQLAWLRGDLEANRRACSIAFWHQPLFSSGPNGPSPGLRDTWRLLYEFNVDLVLNGHDHLYERFGPQDPDGRPDETRGIRQFTVGTGGASLYRQATRRANSEALSSAYGVLKLTLRANDYQWQFLPVPGSADAGDSGTDRCR